MPQSAAALQPPTFLDWVRPPQQARTRKTLTRLLDAAEALVAEKGFGDAGIAEIAQRAGSSVGGFYRRFRDKQRLLQALHERFCEEAKATADVALDPQRWAGAPVAEIWEEFSAFLVRIYREREGLFRAFLRCGISDPEVRERSNRLFEYLAERLAALLEGREIAHPEARLGARFGLQVVLSTLNHVVQMQPPAMGLHDDRLARELSRVFLSYLGAEPNDIRTPPFERSRS
jgi:AcrR family transcriptional regulator